MINDIRILQGAQALNELQKRQLMPRGEIGALLESLKGEEGLAIAETIKKAWQTFETMPKTYDTRELETTTAHLHYFTGGWDWYITERDVETRQLQAFGFVTSDLCPDGEWGYISLEEIAGRRRA